MPVFDKLEPKVTRYWQLGTIYENEVAIANIYRVHDNAFFSSLAFTEVGIPGRCHTPTTPPWLAESAPTCLLLVKSKFAIAPTTVKRFGDHLQRPYTTHPRSRKLTYSSGPKLMAMQLFGRIIPRTNLVRCAKFGSYVIKVGRFDG